jgi:hypothetical protein
MSGACKRNGQDRASARLSNRDRDARLHHDAAGTRTRHRAAASAICQSAGGAIAEARGAGLPFAGVFSAYWPPAFGVGGFVDKFHSLHTYGLAVDVVGIGGPGTPEALLWHEIAARHGVICPYGPHNLVEWNHCQPTRVKIIFAENPLRETVMADGPISAASNPRHTCGELCGPPSAVTDCAGRDILSAATSAPFAWRYRVVPW